jgi:hypothetical protein
MSEAFNDEYICDSNNCTNNPEGIMNTNRCVGDETPR